ncbi:MAG TPA: VacJ family lipoprotein [Burkholderiales bacterium]|nr:VacJ family lipoprotein [Burkholderiales bacterium]
MTTHLQPQIPAGAPARGARGLLAAALAVALLLVSGCATNGNPRDPLEPMNRSVYKFNDGFDKAIARPVAEGYRTVVPQIIRTGVTNFFSNLEDVWIMVNNVLQGKPKDALDDLARVTINTSVGLFGVMDWASEAGLPKHNEDFGQTLGRWGVGSGPYLVLPFFGPSDVRDALAWGLVDSHGDIVRNLNNVPTRNELLVLRLINLRANLLDATRIVEEAAIDPYSFVRDAYLQRRQNLVYDGNPPREKDSAAEQAPVQPVAATPAATPGAAPPTTTGAAAAPTAPAGAAAAPAAEADAAPNASAQQASPQQARSMDIQVQPAGPAKSADAASGTAAPEAANRAPTPALAASAGPRATP